MLTSIRTLSGTGFSWWAEDGPQEMYNGGYLWAGSADVPEGTVGHRIRRKGGIILYSII